MSYIEAYQGRSDTVIQDITTDSSTFINFSEIDFEPYGNPDVEVDSGARFATHDIIGGTTVRQKIGEEPREITVSGVCTEDVAQQINRLHRAELCTLNSDVVGDQIRCQIASSGTSPMASGGGADMDGGDFLYDYSITLVEVEIV